jgi:hypothetical protein
VLASFGFKWFVSETNLQQVMGAVKAKIGLKWNQFSLD